MPEKESYIVVTNRKEGTEDDLRKFLESVQVNQEITVQQVTGEPPTRVKIQAQPHVVEGLRQVFGSKLIIERDQTLKWMG